MTGKDFFSTTKKRCLKWRLDKTWKLRSTEIWS